MKIAQLIANKGPFVATITSEANIAHLVDDLKRHNIGAAVVSPDGRTVEGIVSERDIVRAMTEHLRDIATLTVGQIMTTEVYTCAPDDSVEELMGQMTEHRFRHVPVIDADGALIAVVSIGDLVKHRLAELGDERAALINYITS